MCPGAHPLGKRLITLVQADDEDWAHQAPADVPADQAHQPRAALQRLLATLQEPKVAAERILAAVEAIYELTHGDLDNRARHRVEDILAPLGDAVVE